MVESPLLVAREHAHRCPSCGHTFVCGRISDAAIVIRAAVAYIAGHPGSTGHQIISALVEGRAAQSRNAAAQAIYRAYRAGAVRREGQNRVFRYYPNADA